MPWITLCSLYFDKCSILYKEEIHKEDSKEMTRTRKRRWWSQH
jgi:hypothetical protein